MNKILVLKGKRKAFVSENDLQIANAAGWREPKVGDKIDGMVVVPVEEKKPKKVKEEKKEVAETESNDILT